MPSRPDASFRNFPTQPSISAARALGGLRAYSVIATPDPATPPPMDDDRDYAGNTPSEKQHYADMVDAGQIVAWTLPELAFPVPAGDNVINFNGMWRYLHDELPDHTTGFVISPIYYSMVDVLITDEEDIELWHWKGRLLVETFTPVLQRSPSGGIDQWPGTRSVVTHDEWFRLPPLFEDANCTVTCWLIRDLPEDLTMTGEDIQRSHMVALVSGQDNNAAPSNGNLLYDNDNYASPNPPDVAFEPFQ